MDNLHQIDFHNDRQKPEQGADGEVTDVKIPDEAESAVSDKREASLGAVTKRELTTNTNSTKVTVFFMVFSK